MPFSPPLSETPYNPSAQSRTDDATTTAIIALIAVAATTLVGRECVEVTDDASPQGGRTVALWEPPLMEGLAGEHGAPVRRTAPVEASAIMASLVAEGARTLTFVRSRAGAESTALRARERLASEHGARGLELAGRIAAYRAGYLADDRRELERGLAEGELVGVASTSALELGVDISGLDAVRAITAGDVDPAHFDAVGDDWDVEERALALLGSLGLGHIGLDRTAIGQDIYGLLQQADALDRCGQFGDGHARGLAHVAASRPRHQPRQWNQNQVLGRVGHFQRRGGFDGAGFDLGIGVHGDNS